MTIKVIQADAKAALNAANEACRNMDGELDIDALTRAFASHADPLRRALEPFSIALGNVADTDLETYPDSETIEFSGAPEFITWGHLREARRVLSALSNTQPSPAYSMEKNK